MKLSARVALALLAAAISLAALPLRADEPATVAPAPKVMSGDPEKLKAAQQDLAKSIPELGALVKDRAVYTDPDKKAAALAAALPIFERLEADAKEISTWGPGMKWQVNQINGTMNPIRAALGEPTYIATLSKQAKGDDQTEASAAKAMLARAKFMNANNDADAQGKAVDDLAAALKADSASDAIAITLYTLHEDKHAAKPIVERTAAMIKNDATGKTAGQIIKQWDAVARLAAIDGKPLTIKNFTLDGKEFSSETLKGKVVMVDFWATWCGPCIAELPRVVKVYEKFHPQGLEIISISFDQKVDPINKFLGEHAEVTWTQLFNPKAPGWSAGEEWGIMSIPTMFLIDKKGVCRTINGRAEMDTLIPKLLAE